MGAIPWEKMNYNIYVLIWHNNKQLLHWIKKRANAKASLVYPSVRKFNNSSISLLKINQKVKTDQKRRNYSWNLNKLWSKCKILWKNDLLMFALLTYSVLLQYSIIPGIIIDNCFLLLASWFPRLALQTRFPGPVTHAEARSSGCSH